VFKLWYFVVCLVCLLSGVLWRHLATRAYDFCEWPACQLGTLRPSSDDVWRGFVVRMDKTITIDVINVRLLCRL